MFKSIIRWFKREPANEEWPDVERRRTPTKGRRRTDAYVSVSNGKSLQAPAAAPETRTVRPGTARNAVTRSAQPPRKVVVRNRYVREDTGTHETLKIVDDSIPEHFDDGGIDPYNSGEFDRSRHWERNFRG